MQNQQLILFIHNVAQTGIVFKKSIQKSDKALLKKVFEYEVKAFKHSEKLLDSKDVFNSESEKVLFINQMLSVSAGFSRLSYLLKAKKLKNAEKFIAIINDFITCLQKIENMESMISFKTLEKVRIWTKESVSNESLFDYALAETLESLFMSLKSSSDMIKVF